MYLEFRVLTIELPKHFPHIFFLFFRKERIVQVRAKVGEKDAGLLVAVLRTDSLSVLSCSDTAEPVVLLDQKVEGLCRRSG